MADPAARIARRRFGVRDLTRLAGWGLATLGVLTVAVYAASFPAAEDRLILAVAHLRGVEPPEHLAQAARPSANREIVEAIRDMATERDQLLARLDTLERNVGEITGSIARVTAATPPPASPASVATPAPMAPAPMAAPTDLMPPEIVPSLPPSAAVPAAPAEPQAPGKVEFGVDLGRATNVEGLRQLWTTLRSKHPAALEGLRPIVALREVNRQGGSVEFRLVAGPLANAATAARLCASLAGIACHPTVFDGQKLALR